jgi:hypothetical protein
MLAASKGTSAWRTTYDALVPFEAASMAVQRVINQNSEAPKAREVTSAAQEVIDSLMEEGGSTSFELQRGGQSILVQVQREDRTLAQQGYVIPSVEARAAARAEQERAAKKAARRSYGRRRQLGL